MPYEYYTTAVTTAGSFVWTAPATVTEVYAQVWGAGGAGGGQGITSDGGGGGGGGAYAAGYALVTGGTNYNVCVGAGGVPTCPGQGGTGGCSWFYSATCIMALGGIGGKNSTGTVPADSGGLGGCAVGSIGTTKYSGGRGEAGRDQTNGCGGYGGSSAGWAASGYSGPTTGNWNTSTYPTASTPAGAGHGGNGGGLCVNGLIPASGFGGGGGGSGECSAATGARCGGPGYQGQVCLCWYVFTPTIVTSTF